MPSGGHRGGIFPVGGFKVSTLGKFRKPGLYHTSKFSLFTPRLKYVAYKGLNAASEAEDLIPQDRYSNTAYLAFPAYASVNNRTIQINERKYLLPLRRCSLPKLQNYISNVLDPPDAVHCSGIGFPGIAAVAPPNISQQPYIPTFMKQLIKSFKSRHSLYEAIENVKSPPLPIKELEKIGLEIPIWSSGAKDGAVTSNPFPFVDTSSSAVSRLNISSILYYRSNHRLNSRRHPIWMKRRMQLLRAHIPYLLRRAIVQDQVNSKLARNITE